MKFRWRFSRMFGPDRAAPLYVRRRKRNPVDHRIVRLGPIEVRW